MSFVKNANMGFAVRLVCISFLGMAALSALVGAAKEIEVGGHEGWREPAGSNEAALYDQWAARTRFRIGDTLRFKYTNDSVIEVDKWGFYHCNTSNAISTFTDGQATVVELKNPGPIYFISGAPEHCKHGQRVAVDVMSPHHVSHSPPSAVPAAPPMPYVDGGDSSLSPSPLSISGGVQFLLSPCPVPTICMGPILFGTLGVFWYLGM